jgi:hypothetical protein
MISNDGTHYVVSFKFMWIIIYPKKNRENKMFKQSWSTIPYIFTQRATTFRMNANLHLVLDMNKRVADIQTLPLFIANFQMVYRYKQTMQCMQRSLTLTV